LERRRSRNGPSPGAVPAAQWSGTILPAHSRLPANWDDPGDRPGFGRWTHYLKHYCQELSVR